MALVAVLGGLDANRGRGLEGKGGGPAAECGGGDDSLSAGRLGVIGRGGGTEGGLDTGSTEVPASITDGMCSL